MDREFLPVRIAILTKPALDFFLRGRVVKITPTVVRARIFSIAKIVRHLTHSP